MKGKLLHPKSHESSSILSYADVNRLPVIVMKSYSWLIDGPWVRNQTAENKDGLHNFMKSSLVLINPLINYWYPLWNKVVYITFYCFYLVWILNNIFTDFFFLYKTVIKLVLSLGKCYICTYSEHCLKYILHSHPKLINAFS